MCVPDPTRTKQLHCSLPRQSLLKRYFPCHHRSQQTRGKSGELKRTARLIQLVLAEPPAFANIGLIFCKCCKLIPDHQSVCMQFCSCFTHALVFPFHVKQSFLVVNRGNRSSRQKYSLLMEQVYTQIEEN